LHEVVGAWVGVPPVPDWVGIALGVAAAIGSAGGGVVIAWAGGEILVKVCVWW
jgi:hypothetical protein